MRSAITVSLVPEAKGGPFVFWDDLPMACQKAHELGFDAIELFAPGPDAVPLPLLERLLGDYKLSLAAVGTGAGWVKHKLLLTSPDPEQRKKAIAFVQSMIDFGANFGAPAILGSMQGRWGDGLDNATALGYLLEALTKLAPAKGVLIYEPLNRYETNLFNRLEDAQALLRSIPGTNVKLLADLFHMNIEEANLPSVIRKVGDAIGHVHLADSNRWPAGFGHTDFAAIGEALRSFNYKGYISAEAFPKPDADEAARATIKAFRKDFQRPAA